MGLVIRGQRFFASCLECAQKKNSFAKCRMTYKHVGEDFSGDNAPTPKKGCRSQPVVKRRVYRRKGEREESDHHGEAKLSDMESFHNALQDAVDSGGVSSEERIRWSGMMLLQQVVVPLSGILVS